MNERNLFRRIRHHDELATVNPPHKEIGEYKRHLGSYEIRQCMRLNRMRRNLRILDRKIGAVNKEISEVLSEVVRMARERPELSSEEIWSLESPWRKS